MTAALDQSTPAEEPLVEVCQHGEMVAHTAGPMLMLPDGRPGVKWGGLVFPLREDCRIDVADAGLQPSQCRPWVTSVPAWYLQTGPSGLDCYVFLEGDAAARDRAVQVLSKGGIHVLRAGPNLSGTPGDWFLRLETPGPEIETTLQNLLGMANAPAPQETGIRERLLTEALEQAAAARQRLRLELETSHAKIAASALQAEERAQLRAQFDAMAERLSVAETELAELRSQTQAPLPRAGALVRLEKEFEVAAGIFLPRLQLVAASMAFISVELSDRAPIWRILAALDRQERGQPVGWKSLSGHAGWWEKHFSTGQDDQGRVYAKLVAAGSTWQVLVSHKQQQQSDLRRLHRLAV